MIKKLTIFIFEGNQCPPGDTMLDLIKHGVYLQLGIFLREYGEGKNDNYICRQLIGKISFSREG